MDLRVGSDRPLRGAPRASFTLYLNNPQNLFLLLPRLVSREYCEFFNVARRRKKKTKVRRTRTPIFPSAEFRDLD